MFLRDAFGNTRSKLEALSFSARQGRERLPELEISQSGERQQRQRLHNGRMIGEGRSGFFNRKIEHFVNRTPYPVVKLRTNGKDPVLPATAAADGAGKVNVGQELHLNVLPSCSRTVRASSFAGIEGKIRGRGSSLCGLRTGAEKFAYRCEYACVAGGIAASCTAERALVNKFHGGRQIAGKNGGRDIARVFAGAARGTVGRSQCASHKGNKRFGDER